MLPNKQAFSFFLTKLPFGNELFMQESSTNSPTYMESNGLTRKRKQKKNSTKLTPLTANSAT